MKLINHFITEVRRFSRQNWWVYIMYLLILCLIYYRQKHELVPVNLVVGIHFIGDIFIMMMLNAYVQKKYALGTYFQVVSMLLFLAIKVFTGLKGGGWHYLLADPLYILAALKNYYKDVKQKEIRIINLYSTTIVSIAIMSAFFLFTSTASQSLANSLSKCIQTTGIFMFAIALSVTGNERTRYRLSVVAQTIMVLGSAYETLNTWNEGKVVGLAISYMLLPLTVLIFYLRNWKKIMLPPLLPDNRQQDSAGRQGHNKIIFTNHGDITGADNAQPGKKDTR